MKLYIAEKPSVANDIAKALGGNFQKKDGYLESADNVVTWCYGHLLKPIEPGSNVVALHQPYPVTAF